MHYPNEEAFSKALREGRPQGLYLLYGKEEYLVAAYAKKITAAFSGGGASVFNLQKLDGRRLDLDELYMATEAMPLMAEDKCVVLDDIDLSKLPGGDFSQLADILGDLSPACVLVITAKAPLFDPRSAVGKKLIKLAGEVGASVELGARGQSGLQSFLKSAAKRGGCEASTDVCRYILQTCENDMGTLACEMEKICAYAGGGPLTREHVDVVAIPKTEARVFDLNKAVLAGNPQRAMEILRDLFYLRESPIAILSVLILSYADLYRARVAKDAGKTPADLVALFPAYKGKEFRVNNAYSARISAKHLRQCLDALWQCDRKLKSTGVDGRILLEQTVTRLLAIQGARG